MAFYQSSVLCLLYGLMAAIPVECCGADVPALCIVSRKRQDLPDDNLRGSNPIVTSPSLTPSCVREWEHYPVLETDVLVREVIPSEEKITYKKNSLHKVNNVLL